ncbi:hypothetical protein KXW98_002796 [Aspergillus fumigatus]|uniref:G-patch domain protein, putative n=1 Tax=Aspergillus fumigatus (strain CBS 144.89 / FGSC A1163 / CEA10) TaxID=451804 RepID=B0Y0S8_ASPFC|nr:G-patch domain protein, putative [Aspergillus fumigatus A1163]KAF4288661.1 hypothetical protein CNMCM8689_002849 [Aspergillus fumigatus]KAH1320042.1 hypothetical protein KXX38_009589 [Aspergillus fumigatus]KAH1375211.1 hypothetical protein KXX10_001899 [Aspergillus fumigatus]KAH1399109.1 hypothetical protein KXX49_001054 [Aspergillus fumigatus]
MSHNNDEDYFLPLEDQRVFGAGIRRRRVQFVRSSEHELNTTTTTTTTRTTTPSTTSGLSPADKYLSIVLPKEKLHTQTTEPATTRNETVSAPPSPEAVPAPVQRCEVCNLPLDGSKAGTDEEGSARPHEASLAHQLCLSHSHPPSHLDRSRHGLRYLSAYGWDPDSRLGLGAPGREGIREPLKGRLKVDTVGLGAEVEPSAKGKKRVAAAAAVPSKVQRLNAKQVRKGHFDAKRRGEMLREIFYQKDDVQRYLSGDA